MVYSRICVCVTLMAFAGCAFEGGGEKPAEKADAGASIGAAEIGRLGILARTKPGERNGAVMEIARMMALLGREDVGRAHELKKPFQEALLLVCDRDVFATLSAEAVGAVDDALETLLSLDDIRRDYRWHELSYVYGFFNHDVTAEEVRGACEEWMGIPIEKRGAVYPTFIHLIDAVTKPLSMGALANDEETSRALSVAVPTLKSMLTQPPRPGTAFHEPSHAALVIAPLYERWIDSPEYGAFIRRHLGSRAEFETLMGDQLVGSRESAAGLEDFEFGFYAYTGRYLANALARLNARSAAPALRRSLEIYESGGGPGSTIAYTRRALIALGDVEARRAFEASADRSGTVKTLVWLCRNGQGETVEYASGRLGAMLGCEPGEALLRHFEGL